MAPKLNTWRAVFVLVKIDEILTWERGRERDMRFVDLGRYLCEVRSGQYWCLDRLKLFDEFLERRFPDSRRKAYYLMAMLARMYKKWLAGYSALGSIVSEAPGAKYLLLVNETKRRYSFVRKSLTKRWFCDGYANQTEQPSWQLRPQVLQRRIFQGLCAPAVAAPAAASPSAALASAGAGNPGAWTPGRTCVHSARSFAVHLPLRSKGSRTLFADRGHAVVVF